MNNLNSVLIEGNLVREPELTKLVSGKTVTEFPIANHRYHRNAKGEPVDDTTFLDVKCWDALAERCAETLNKGRAVRLVGRITQETWIDAKRKNHSRLVLVAEHVELAVGGGRHQGNRRQHGRVLSRAAAIGNGDGHLLHDRRTNGMPLVSLTRILSIFLLVHFSLQAHRHRAPRRGAWQNLHCNAPNAVSYHGDASDAVT